MIYASGQNSSVDTQTHLLKYALLEAKSGESQERLSEQEQAVAQQGAVRAKHVGSRPSSHGHNPGMPLAMDTLLKSAAPSSTDQQSANTLAAHGREMVQGTEFVLAEVSAQPKAGQEPAAGNLVAEEILTSSLDMAQVEPTAGTSPRPGPSADPAPACADPQVERNTSLAALSDSQASLQGSPTNAASGTLHDSLASGAGVPEQAKQATGSTSKRAKHAALAALAARRDQATTPSLPATAAAAQPAVLPIVPAYALAGSPIRTLSRASSAAASKVVTARGVQQAVSVDSLPDCSTTGSPAKGDSREASAAGSRASSGRRSLQSAVGLPETVEPACSSHSGFRQHSALGSRASSASKRAHNAEALLEVVHADPLSDKGTEQSGAAASGANSDSGEQHPVAAVAHEGVEDAYSSRTHNRAGSRASSGRQITHTDASLHEAGGTEIVNSSSRQHSAARQRSGNRQQHQLSELHASLPLAQGIESSPCSVSRSHSAAKPRTSNETSRLSNSGGRNDEQGLTITSASGEGSNASLQAYGAGLTVTCGSLGQPADVSDPDAVVAVDEQLLSHTPSRQHSSSISKQDRQTSSSISKQGSMEQNAEDAMQMQAALQQSDLTAVASVTEPPSAASYDTAEGSRSGTPNVEAAATQTTGDPRQVQHAAAMPASTYSETATSSQVSLASSGLNAQQAQRSTDWAASAASLQLLSRAASAVQQRDPSREQIGVSLSQLGLQGGAGIVRHSVVLGTPASQLSLHHSGLLCPLDYSKLKADLQASYGPPVL